MILRAFLAASLCAFVACGSSRATSVADGAAPDHGAAGSDAAAPTDAAVLDAANVARPATPCVAAGSCPPGVWVDVTPPGVDLTDGACGNYGTKAVQVDPLRASDLYVEFNCQGIWKSTDYGQTWTGPINTGANGALVGNCAAVLSIGRGPDGGAPTLYESCVRGDGIGFWRSTNGGVDWTRYDVLPNGGAATAVNQQFYSPAVDPHDASHLLMAAHQTDLLVESTDGGQTWKSVTMDPGMMANDGGTGGIDFVDTGDAATTRQTWLWLAAAIGVDATGVGTVGTWRTTDGGASWKRVDANEHVNGSMHSELFQPAPASSGVLYMAGQYSAEGAGVLRSSDFGQTWTHVGKDQPEAVVFATPSHVYAMFGWAAGAGAVVDPALEMGDAAAPAASWTSPGTPAAMTQGPGQAAVTNDGAHNIVFVGDYNAGLWRYVEPVN